jgi:protein-L-isoaspartate(D-aspartate) O-methyltransferase
MEEQTPTHHDDQALALNRALIDELKNKKLILTPQVEAAFRSVLRHHFLPDTPLEEVYSDRAISAKQDAEGKWISSSSQPAIMAIMLEQLGLQPGHNVLEIGTGPGYNAALMAHIVGETGRIVSVEIDRDLAESARAHLSMAGYERVHVVCADGGYGYPEAAPYDRIILTVGSHDITPAWWEQMKPDGRLVLPLVLRGSMKSIAFERAGDHLASLSENDCGFIQLRGDFASTSQDRIELGPEPGLRLEAIEQLPIASDTIYHLLTAESQDQPAGVEVTTWDVLQGSLWTWLSLHEPRLGRLVAEGDVAEQGIVPAMIRVEGRNLAATAILLGETGLAMLTRPPDQPIPTVTMDKLYAPDSPAAWPFPLFVRQLGPDGTPARRLLNLVQDWKEAGTPARELHIRAYHRDTDYTPAAGEIVLDKPWTKLVISGLGGS